MLLDRNLRQQLCYLEYKRGIVGAREDVLKRHLTICLDHTAYL